MKTVGEEAFIIYHILYTYIKISKIGQKFRNSLIVKKSTSQLSDIIVNACMQFENFPIKTVGVEAFYSFYIIHNYFKISKIRQKFKNSLKIWKKSSGPALGVGPIRVLPHTFLFDIWLYLFRCTLFGKTVKKSWKIRKL